MSLRIYLQGFTANFPNKEIKTSYEFPGGFCQGKMSKVFVEKNCSFCLGRSWPVFGNGLGGPGGGIREGGSEEGARSGGEGFFSNSYWFLMLGEEFG